MLQRERSFILLNSLYCLNSKVSNVHKICNCPYSIIISFSENIYALKYIYWLDFSFPNKDLGFFFILENHSFVVWKLFIFLTSQTCHLEKLDELFLYTSKYPYSSSFFLRVTFKLSDFPMLLSVIFIFCAHLNFGKYFSIDLQCNIKLQNQNAVNEIAGKNCLFLLHLWVHLFFLFFHLPLLASLVKQQLFT